MLFLESRTGILALNQNSSVLLIVALVLSRRVFFSERVLYNKKLRTCRFDGSLLPTMSLLSCPIKYNSVFFLVTDILSND